MHTSPLALVLLGLTLGCGEAQRAPEAALPATAPPTSTSTVAAPAVSPSSSDGVSESSAVETAVGEAVPLPDPWGRAKDIRSAVGGGHYAKGVAGGQRYMVEDARTGERVSIGIPLIVMDGGQPRAYPTAAHTGHVIFKARAQGEEVLLDYAIHWDPSATRGDGSTGGFLVDSVVLLQRGDAPPAARFVRDGDWWRREVGQAEPPAGAPSPAVAPTPPG